MVVKLAIRVTILVPMLSKMQGYFLEFEIRLTDRDYDKCSLSDALLRLFNMPRTQLKGVAAPTVKTRFPRTYDTNGEIPFEREFWRDVEMGFNDRTMKLMLPD